jgi:hypothetical protein
LALSNLLLTNKILPGQALNNVDWHYFRITITAMVLAFLFIFLSRNLISVYIFKFSNLYIDKEFWLMFGLSLLEIVSTFYSTLLVRKGLYIKCLESLAIGAILVWLLGFLGVGYWQSLFLSYVVLILNLLRNVSNLKRIGNVL